MIIAVDIGGTNLRVALINRSGKILKIKKVPTPKQEKITDKIVLLIQETLTAREIKNAEMISISTPGKANNKKGTVTASNLGGKSIELSKPLKRKLKKDVFLINDTNAAAYNEYVNYYKNTKNLAYVSISTGIGCGVVIDGSLIFGADNTAAEFGHITVKEEDYEIICGCGYKNHWQAFVSGKDMPHFLKLWTKKENKKLIGEYETAKEIFESAKNGNKTLIDFLEKVGEFNGKGISAIIAAYNPEIIVLGGSVVLNNQKEILDGIIKNIEKYFKAPKIKVTTSGDNACLLGAAAYIFKKKTEGNDEPRETNR